jgi:O-antigen ligase
MTAERSTLGRVQTGLVAATGATCLLSIFSAQLALALALAVFLLRLSRGATRLERTPLDTPIVVFCVWTLLSAAFSTNPLVAHEDAKKLVLFALFYLALDSAARGPDRERVMDAVLLGGLALAGGAILQFHFLGFDTINTRPKSFLGHYMTASGLFMAVLIVAAARLAFFRGWALPGRADFQLLAGLAAGLGLLTALQGAGVFALEAERLFVAALAVAAIGMILAPDGWPNAGTSTALALLAFALSAWSLLLSRTRNAWLGALAGLVVVSVLRSRRALWLVGAAVAVVLVVRPATVIDRLTLTDESTRDRYYMWQAGIDMILDRPVFGQGPGMIVVTYPQYRWPEAPQPFAPHLHDNALQIAAERGIPCAVFWLWLVVAAMADFWRECRRGLSGPGWVAGAALALFAAVMAAGLFEYNFGDSEILMLTLIVASLPYALRRERQATA